MYVYGKNVARELLNKKEKIQKCYLYRDFKDKDIINALQNNNIEIIYSEKYALDKLVNANHQGIILAIEEFKYSSLDEIIHVDEAFIVILDHLEDPHNLGAIIRTCEAANITGIIIPKDRSVEVNPTVIKVSTGAIENIKIVQVTNLVQTIKTLKENGFWIIGTDMEGTNYHDIDYNGKIGLVIGNEGSGISKLVKENCDFIATIPMYGKVNSLNASVATGIFIYEAISKRK